MATPKLFKGKSRPYNIKRFSPKKPDIFYPHNKNICDVFYEQQTSNVKKGRCRSQNEI